LRWSSEQEKRLLCEIQRAELGADGFGFFLPVQKPGWEKSYLSKKQRDGFGFHV
jgi:hypothetical protein